MLKINEKIKSDKKFKANMLLQIHDELIFECLESDKNYNIKNIRELMQSVNTSQFHKFSIPLEVNINSGYNWEEAH